MMESIYHPRSELNRHRYRGVFGLILFVASSAKLLDEFGAELEESLFLCGVRLVVRFLAGARVLSTVAITSKMKRQATLNSKRFCVRPHGDWCFEVVSILHEFLELVRREG